MLGYISEVEKADIFILTKDDTFLMIHFQFVNIDWWL